MSHARRSLAYSFSSQYLGLIVQFFSTIIIARLLTPSEIGIFSVGAAFAALGHLLRDFGSGQYIIQEQELTQDRIRAAFAVTLGLGWGIAAVIFLVAPFAAKFYGQTGIEEILSVLALNFLLLPFGSITLAYLRRQMDFKPAAVANVGSTLVSGIVSVSLAYLGHGYMSLAWGSLAATVSTILLVNLFRPKGLPLLPGILEIRRVVGFGSKMSMVTILGELASITPELALGKTQGFHAVGLFSRAQGIAGLFRHLVMRGAGPVIGPAFASKKRGGENLHAAYVYGTKCVTGLAWSFYANLVVLASPFVVGLYGEQWLEAIPLLQIWCVAGSIYHLSSLVEQVFPNTGEIDRLVRFSLLQHPLRIAVFAGAAFISLEAVVMSTVLFASLRLVLLWSDLRAVVGVGVKDYREILIVSGIPAVTSATASLFSTYILDMMHVHEPLVILSVCGTAAGIVWIFSAHLLGHPLSSELWKLVPKRWPLPSVRNDGQQ